jgi:hypothetical protein
MKFYSESLGRNIVFYDEGMIEKYLMSLDPKERETKQKKYADAIQAVSDKLLKTKTVLDAMKNNSNVTIPTKEKKEKQTLKEMEISDTAISKTWNTIAKKISDVGGNIPNQNIGDAGRVGAQLLNTYSKRYSLTIRDIAIILTWFFDPKDENIKYLLEAGVVRKPNRQKKDDGMLDYPNKNSAKDLAEFWDQLDKEGIIILSSGNVARRPKAQSDLVKKRKEKVVSATEMKKNLQKIKTRHDEIRKKIDEFYNYQLEVQTAIENPAISDRVMAKPANRSKSPEQLEKLIKAEAEKYVQDKFGYAKPEVNKLIQVLKKKF